MSVFTKTLVASALALTTAYANAERVIINVDETNKGIVKSLISQQGQIKLESSKFFAVEFKGKNLSAIKGMRFNAHAKSVEIDVKRFPTAIYADDIGDPYATQLTPYAVYQSEANLVTPGAAVKKVCVIDSGINQANNDFTWSAIDGDNDLGTGNWYEPGGEHGTHVAGTIAAQDNSVGVIGMSPNANLHIVKVFNSDGWGYSSDLAHATTLCEVAGANIINLSLGGGSPNSTESNAFANFTSGGGLVVAAAGNAGNSVRNYPAGYPSVMMVGANDANNNIAYFSQHPECATYKGRKARFNDSVCVEVSAGGVNTLSTYKAGYARMSGTSMATPAVSGVAALVWSHFDNCTGTEIRDALKITAQDNGASGHDIHFGYGIVKAKTAFDYLTNTGCSADSTPEPEPEPEPIDPGTGFTISAKAYKSKGLQKVDLSWSGSSASSFDVYRDGRIIGASASSQYTDNINKKGGGQYIYKTCSKGTTECSNSLTVTF